MSYLEELLPEFRNGAKIRRKSWDFSEYIYLNIERCRTMDNYNVIYDFKNSDMMSGDWELYQEPIDIDWEYIIKNKCLCWFWDLDPDYKTIGFLKKWVKGIDYPFSNETDGGYYINCSPICKDEATFYENKKMITNSKIGDYNPKCGIYAGMCNEKQIWVALKDAPKEMNWEDAKKYCEELDADCDGWHLPTKEELMIIYANKDIINKALKKHGGEPMGEYWYWSSSEYSLNGAWSVYAGNGDVGWGLKDDYGYVRCVLA